MRCHHSENMHVEIELSGQEAVVTVTGEIDRSSAPAFSRCLREAASQARTLVVNLSGISFLDCSGLAALAAARDTLRAQDRVLLLHGAHGVVRRAIGVSDLADLLDEESRGEEKGER